MTYSIPSFTIAGKAGKAVNLDAAIFSDEMVNEKLVKQFVLMCLANMRSPIAHTKTRGEVKNSGRKLYRQKGTGNARVGDAGSPIRRSGGVTFGPRKERSFAQKMPKKMRQRALRSALIIKAREESMMGCDIASFDSHSTSGVIDLMKALKIEGKKVMFIVDSSNSVFAQSAQNIDRVITKRVDYVNAYDLLAYDKIVVADQCLPVLLERA